MSPLDLINFTLRISKQNKSPPEGILYFGKYLPDINNQDNSILYTNHFIKNKNKFLYLYPNGFFGMKNSILRYDLSNNNRLLPPILSKEGREIIFKYPKENPPSNIYYKYSKDPNIIPSFFSGEEYTDYSRPYLVKDCIIKACTCKEGFKDSEIATFKFTVDSKEKINIVIKKPPGKTSNVLTKPVFSLDTGSLRFEPINCSSSFSPRTSSPKGSSMHESNYNDLGKRNNDENEEDE